MPPARRSRRAPSAPAPLRLTKIALCLALATAAGCGDPDDEPGFSEEARVGPAETRPAAVPGIRPGEMLDVFVLEDETFNGKYQVRAGGDIIMPKIGRVRVGSMSATGAQSAVKRALERDQLTTATVVVDRPALLESGPVADGSLSIDAFLSGKVVRPGRYTLTGIGSAPPTVHQAILQAGGTSRFAHKKKAHILRRGGDGRLERIDADLEAIERGERPDIPLAEGDIVVVPEKRVDVGL